MGNNLVNLGQTTKAQLETIRDSHDHKSLDSVVRTLLKDHELAAVYRTLHDDLPPGAATDYTPRSSDPYDPTTAPARAHRLYAGAVGSGKKAVVTEDLITTLQRDDAPRVVYLDPFGDAELHRVAEATDTTVDRLTAGETDDINPLFAGTPDHTDAKAQGAAWALQELLALPAMPDSAPDPTDDSVAEILEQATALLYADQSEAAYWPTLADVCAQLEALTPDGAHAAEWATAEDVYAAFHALTQGGGGVFAEGENLLATTDADVLNVSCATESSLEMVAAFVYFAECARVVDDAVTIVVRDTQGLGLTGADAAGWASLQSYLDATAQHDRTVWVEVQALSEVPAEGREVFDVRRLFRAGVGDLDAAAVGLDRAGREFLRNAAVIPINDGDEGVVEFLCQDTPEADDWTAHYAQL